MLVLSEYTNGLVEKKTYQLDKFVLYHIDARDITLI
jgi:hypothetical protein